MEKRYIELKIEAGKEQYGAFIQWYSPLQEESGEQSRMLNEMLQVINKKYPTGYKVIKFKTGIFNE